MKKKRPIILEELIIWLRGRFTLTSEEKFWLLLILIICWTGLVARYFYQARQPAVQFTNKPSGICTNEVSGL
ncbi:MAG: hypothetical protein AB7E95_04965 [Kiritimatiellales bacterium]|jgi:nitrate reductase gamma subunit